MGSGSNEHWISDFLGTKTKQKDLAKATGLKVMLNAGVQKSM